MLTRRLVFHRWASTPGRPRFVPHEVAAALQASIAADQSFSILDTGDLVSSVEVTEVGSATQQTNIKLFALRSHDDRPFKWAPDTSSNPIDLNPSEYAADVTHISIWPNGVCAHDYAKETPRPSRLAAYLRRRMNSHVHFDSLYREDTKRKLEAMRGQLRSAEIAFTQTGSNSPGRGTFGTLFPAALGEKAPSMRLTLGMGRYGPRDRYLDSETEEEIIALAERADDFLSNMVIRGRSNSTGRVETINLLHERIQEEVRFNRDVRITSTPRSSEVWDALDRAYKNFVQQGLFDTAVRGEMMRNKD